jgi:hypothetical protein
MNELNYFSDLLINIPANLAFTRSLSFFIKTEKIKATKIEQYQKNN